MEERDPRGRLGALALAVLLAASFGCVVVKKKTVRVTPPPKQVVVKTVPRRGPPAHAPAHGYRKKHEHGSAELVFDSRRGIYIVLGLPSCFWDGKRYYRQVGNKWQSSTELDGRWIKVKTRNLPPGLRANSVPASPSRRDY